MLNSIPVVFVSASVIHYIIQGTLLLGKDEKSLKALGCICAGQQVFKEKTVRLWSELNKLTDNKLSGDAY